MRGVRRGSLVRLEPQTETLEVVKAALGSGGADHREGRGKQGGSGEGRQERSERRQWVKG